MTNKFDTQINAYFRSYLVLQINKSAYARVNSGVSKNPFHQIVVDDLSLQMADIKKLWMLQRRYNLSGCNIYVDYDWTTATFPAMFEGELMSVIVADSFVVEPSCHLFNDFTPTLKLKSNSRRCNHFLQF